MRRITIDTNLLVLLVVGLTSKDLIAKHKRTRAFSVEDYERLADIVTNAGVVMLTAHTLAETSNLLRQVESPAREMILSAFKSMIQNREETSVASRVATDRREFLRLGLTDATLLTLASSGVGLLTVDLDLYLAAQRCGYDAINFNHLREFG